jgi:hypothetical protein
MSAPLSRQEARNSARRAGHSPRIFRLYSLMVETARFLSFHGLFPPMALILPPVSPGLIAAFKRPLEHALKLEMLCPCN